MQEILCKKCHAKYYSANDKLAIHECPKCYGLGIERLATLKVLSHTIRTAVSDSLYSIPKLKFKRIN